jgi:hypothetical protein
MIAVGALWIVVLVLAVLVLGILRRIIPLLTRAESILSQGQDEQGTDGLPIGEQVPEFELIDAEGEVVRPGQSLPLPAVFLFVQQGCEPCQDLVAALSERAESFAGTRLCIIAAGEPDDYNALRARGLFVFGQSEGQALRAFDNNEFPNAFAVDQDAKIVGKMTMDSVADLERLVREADAYGEAYPIASGGRRG